MLAKVLLLWMTPMYLTAGTWDVVDLFMDDILEMGLSKSKVKRNQPVKIFSMESFADAFLIFIAEKNDDNDDDDDNNNDEFHDVS